MTQQRVATPSPKCQTKKAMQNRESCCAALREVHYFPVLMWLLQSLLDANYITKPMEPQTRR